MNKRYFYISNGIIAKTEKKFIKEDSFVFQVEEDGNCKINKDYLISFTINRDI